ncbi:MAG: hypothetical protein LBP88_08565 [Treponema sp.]|nr:hypothetical protein [Treponema sp.]
MAIINSVNETFHRIRVKLYPHYLPFIEGAYIVRTANEASLSIEEVCTALKNGEGFTWTRWEPSLGLGGRLHQD